MMTIKGYEDLSDPNKFRGANIVFVVPDERITELRRIFREQGITNDIFGVREAKGLEFDSV